MQTLWTLAYQFVGWVWVNFAVLLAVVALGFTACQIRDATRAYQASTVSQISARTDELQWRILKNPDLRELLTGDPQPAPAKQQEVVVGLVINHFATMFDLHKLGGIPSEPWEAFKLDMKETLNNPLFRRRWRLLKQYHRPDFVAFVAGELGLTDEQTDAKEE